MRYIATLLSLPILLIATLAAPWVGVVSLAVIYYVRPEIWGAPSWFSLVEIFTGATLLGLVFLGIRGKLRLRGSLPLFLMILLVGWATLSARNAEISRTMGLERTLVYFKCAVAAFLITQLLDTVDRLNWFLWGIVIGTCWTVKSALFLYLTKNPERVDDIGGQGGGANFLALILVISLPILLYRIQAGQRRERLVSLGLLPLWALAMVLSGSRGGFLAMGVVVVAFLLLNRRKGLAMTLVGLAALLFVLFAPARYFDRMKTIEQYQQDRSAMGRIVLWKGALRLSREHPLIGVGPDNFRLLSTRFMPERAAAGENGLVAHSLYLQTLAELGWPGFLLLLALMGSSFLSLVRTGRRAPDTEEGRRLRLYCRMLTVGMVGFAVHSVVMSNLHRDLFWWWMGLAGAAPAILARLSASAVAAPAHGRFAPTERLEPACIEGGT